MQKSNKNYYAIFGREMVSNNVFTTANKNNMSTYGLAQYVQTHPGTCGQDRDSTATTHDPYTLRPRQNGRHFADDISKCICLNENVWIPIKISLKFDPKGPINNIPGVVQIMAWRRPGDKPFSESMMVSS